jgi:superfamily II DNA or RNA helicase
MVVRLISKIKTVPFIFFVLSSDLLEQAYDDLSSCLNVPIGKIGGGVCDIRDINVMTIQTAIRALNIDNENFLASRIADDFELLVLNYRIEINNQRILIKNLTANVVNASTMQGIL